MNKESRVAVARALWIPLAVVSALIFVGISSGLAGESAAAQAATTKAESGEKGTGKADALEEIVVTGSLISRRDLVSDTPISTIDQSSLLAAGQPTLDRLARIPPCHFPSVRCGGR